MFFFHNLQRDVELHPKFFGRQLRRAVEEQIYKEVEGTCSGKHGYVVAVVKVLDTGEGRIREGTGYATFQVTYQALCLRPFKNEVVQATVQTVTKVGFFCFAGPIKIFVSSYLIPEEFEFESTQEAAFASSDGEVRVKAGGEVRVKIVGVRLEPTECTCIATMKEDYMGVVAM